MAQLDDDTDEFSVAEADALAAIRAEADGDANSCAITLITMLEAVAKELSPAQREWLAGGLAAVARDMCAPVRH